jgi:hypothetical protein
MSKIVSFERHGSDWKTGGKHAKDHKMKFDAGSGAQTVTFYIGTPAGRFTFNEKDPIWVTLDDGECPTTPCSYQDITVTRCHGPELVIENANQEKARLRYQLNVYDRDKKEWCPIDPIMDNGGKTRS